MKSYILLHFTLLEITLLWCKLAMKLNIVLLIISEYLQIQDAGNYLLQALNELQMHDDQDNFENGDQVVAVNIHF